MKVHRQQNDKGAMPNLVTEKGETFIQNLPGNSILVEKQEPVMELVTVTDEDGEPIRRDLGNNKTGKYIKRWVQKTDADGNPLFETKRYRKEATKRGFATYHPDPTPTAEEQRVQALAKARKDLNDQLADELVNAGLTAQDLVRALKGARASDAPESVPESVTEDYPKHVGGPWFETSDGERIKGREAAEDYEAGLEPVAS